MIQRFNPFFVIFEAFLKLFQTFFYSISTLFFSTVSSGFSQLSLHITVFTCGKNWILSSHSNKEFKPNFVNKSGTSTPPPPNLFASNSIAILNISSFEFKLALMTLFNFLCTPFSSIKTSLASVNLLMWKVVFIKCRENVENGKNGKQWLRITLFNPRWPQITSFLPWNDPKMTLFWPWNVVFHSKIRHFPPEFDVSKTTLYSFVNSANSAWPIGFSGARFVNQIYLWIIALYFRSRRSSWTSPLIFRTDFSLRWPAFRDCGWTSRVLLCCRCLRWLMAFLPPPIIFRSRKMELECWWGVEIKKETSGRIVRRAKR